MAPSPSPSPTKTEEEKLNNSRSQGVRDRRSAIRTRRDLG